MTSSGSVLLVKVLRVMFSVIKEHCVIVHLYCFEYIADIAAGKTRYQSSDDMRHWTAMDAHSIRLRGWLRGTVVERRPWPANFPVLRLTCS